MLCAHNLQFNLLEMLRNGILHVIFLSSRLSVSPPPLSLPQSAIWTSFSEFMQWRIFCRTTSYWWIPNELFTSVKCAICINNNEQNGEYNFYEIKTVFLIRLNIDMFFFSCVSFLNIMLLALALAMAGSFFSFSLMFFFLHQRWILEKREECSAHVHIFDRTYSIIIIIIIKYSLFLYSVFANANTHEFDRFFFSFIFRRSYFWCFRADRAETKKHVVFVPLFLLARFVVWYLFVDLAVNQFIIYTSYSLLFSRLLNHILCFFSVALFRIRPFAHSEWRCRLSMFSRNKKKKRDGISRLFWLNMRCISQKNRRQSTEWRSFFLWYTQKRTMN